MAYKKLNEVDSTTGVGSILVVENGVVKQISDKAMNEHYGIDNLHKGADMQKGASNANSKRLASLEERLPTSQFKTDILREYSNVVPKGMGKIAEISKLCGMSRKCRNLIPFPYQRSSYEHEGVKYVVNADGSVTANGTASGNSIFALHYYTMPIKKGTYTITGVPANGNTTTFMIQIASRSGFAMNNIAVNGDTFTLDNDVNDLIIQLVVFSGYVANNLVFKPMINEGTTALPYEPYFVGLGSAAVTSIESVGANLCAGIYSSAASVSNGVLTQTKADTKSTLEFILQTYNNSTFVQNISDLKYITAIGRYSWQFVKDSSFNTLTFGHNGAVTDIKCSADVSHLIDGNTYTLSVEITNVTQGSFSWRDVTINEGSTALPYTPYTKNTLPIPAEVQALDGYGCGINESLYNYVDWKKKQFVKRVKRTEFHGTENWAYFSGVGVNQFYLSSLSDVSTSADGNIKTVCSHYKDSTVNERVNNYGTCYSVSNGIAFNVEGILTTAEWKAYLADQYSKGTPVVVFYTLIAPVITDISNILPDDNYIEVEPDGTITFVNEHQIEAPHEVIFTQAESYILEETFNDQLSEMSKRVSRLESRLPKEQFPTDDTVAYSKDVPADVCSYAEVSKIGGMTRKCANFFDASKAQIGYRCNTDGSLVKNSSYATSDYIEVKGGASYYLTNVCGNNYCSAVLFGTDKNTINNASLGAGGNVSGVLTVDDHTKYIRVNIFTDVVDINTVMVHEGSTALPYEPYFEGLRSAPVTEVESVGANLTTAQAVYEGANAYAEMVVDGRNCIKFTSGIQKKNYPIKFKENTQYTVSFYAKSENVNGATAHNYAFTFWYSDDSVSCTQVFLTDTSWTLKTLTSTAGKTVVAVGVQVMEYRANVYLDVDTFMFNEGATALPYKPFTKNTLPIPEAVQALDGYDDGINENCYNYIDFEKKQFAQRVRKVVFDGSSDEYWMIHQFSNLSAYIIPFPNETLVSNDIICDKFEVLPHITGQIDGTIGVAVEGVDLYNGGIFFGVKGLASSVDEWRNYLASNPVTVVVAPSNPIITDISDILPDDNFIYVESGGKLTFVNDSKFAVPSTVTYMSKEVSA